MTKIAPDENQLDASSIAKESQPRTPQLGTALSWSGSILGHLLIVVLAFAITWAVVQQTSDEPPRVISSSPNDSTIEAIQPLKVSSKPASIIQTRSTPGAEESEVTASDLSELMLSADTLLSEASTLTSSSLGEDGDVIPEISFGGVRAPEARRIVFVVDASGSMIGAFPEVISELENSLRSLSPKQFYGILLFQQTNSIEVPPKGKLQSAQNEFISKSMDWIETNIYPTGRSNPTAALRRAFILDPDVIFIVSTNITGSGEFEINKKDLLTTLDELNPMRRSGTRAVRIRCIQLLDKDPLGTLEAIATLHGGREGYAFIDRGQLGLGSSR